LLHSQILSLEVVPFKGGRSIPNACIAPKISGSRIWKFHREKIEAWLREREEG
jgi:hypothetical protein